MHFFSSPKPKDTGSLGEDIACEFLLRKGFQIVERNFARKTGEIDIIARKGDVLHIVEVKSVKVLELPTPSSHEEGYDPAENLHPYKIRKVARTAEWYVASKGWEGEWQVDGVLVWLRAKDGAAHVSYLPQIV